MTPLEVVTQAVFNPLPLAAVALATVWYLRSTRLVTARGLTWPRWRTAAFGLGAAVLVVALSSGVEADSRNFGVHAIQQVLIGTVAPIALAFSAPITLALQSSRDRTQAVITGALRSRPARIVLHPVFAWAFYLVSLSALYFTSLYALTLRDSALHATMLVDIFLAGCLFWWIAVGADPLPNRLGYWAKMAYLLLGMPFHTILGMSLESQTSSIAPGTSLASLHMGGGLLWVAGEVAGLIGAIAVFLQWLHDDEQRAEQHDRTSGATAEQQLAHWRAARDAAARAAGRIST